MRRLKMHFAMKRPRHINFDVGLIYRHVLEIQVVMEVVETINNLLK